VTAKHTETQIIHKNGMPVFAVIPYDEYLKLTGKSSDADIFFPHEVVKLNAIKGFSLIASWRKYKGLTQKQLAKKLNISQAALAQIEKPDSKPQQKTLQKIADALSVNIEQLIE
jgi:DNA-binding XRE family transcriptional regulator